MPPTQKARTIMADTIRNARKNKHMTQQQLADAVGLHVMTIRRYESRDLRLRRTPSVQMCKKISDALELPVSVLLNDYFVVGDDYDTDRSSR